MKAKQVNNKSLFLGVSAVFLILLFLFLFGAHSVSRTRKVRSQNEELERQIADVSYANAELGETTVVSTPSQDGSTEALFSEREAVYEPTGFELLGKVPTTYKWLVVFSFTLLTVFVVVALLLLKKTRLTEKSERVSEDAESEDGGDEAEDDYLDNAVDLSTRPGINKVCDTISTGGIAIIPCDTVYGICALVNDVTKDRITEIKRRDPNKNFIILATLEKAHHLLGKNLVSELYSLWPGPITFIALLADGSEKVALRVPSDPLLTRILAQTGAIYSTSVNFSGEPPLNDIKEIARVFHDKVDIMGYVDGKTFSEPSTIIDASVFPFKVIREGAYPISEFEKRFQVEH